MLMRHTAFAMILPSLRWVGKPLWLVLFAAPLWWMGTPVAAADFPRFRYHEIDEIHVKWLDDYVAQIT